MNLKVRRVIYLAFIAVFFISGSLLLLYLQGFRYNPTKGKLERTGAILVETIPEKATVKLNSLVQADTTPLSLNSLKPGEYEVEIELAGYQPWQKILPVRPSEVTFASSVRLWPATNTGMALGVGKSPLTALSPNRQNLLYFVPSGLTNGLWLLNLTSGQTSLLRRPAGSTVTSLEWSATSREVLVAESDNGSTRWQIYTLDSREWEPVELPSELAPSQIHWGEEKQLLYAATANELYQLNRRTSSSKLLWREKLKDFRVHDGIIFGLTRGSGEAVLLKLITLSNLQPVPMAESLTLSTNPAFQQAIGDWLPLLDEDRHVLYLLRSPLTSSAPLRSLPDVTSLDWDSEATKLLLSNNFEVWEYELAAGEVTFLERVSTSLQQARLLEGYPYVLMASGNEVWALELDGRGERQRWLLASYDTPVRNLFLDPAGELLVVQTENDFYRLELTSTSQPDEPPTSLLEEAIRTYRRLSTLP